MSFMTKIHFCGWLCFFLLCTVGGRASAQTRILSVLCPQGMIDSKIFFDFERQTRINLRVELTSTRREYEQRIKSSANTWDVVIADEGQLIALTTQRLIRAHKGSDTTTMEKEGIFNTVTKFQQENNSYVPIMVNPLGITWLEGAKKQTGMTWKTFLDPNTNPLWRGKLFFPSDRAMQIKIAALSANLNLATSPLSDFPEAVQWLQKAATQTPHLSSQILLELLNRSVVAGIIWKTDYLKMRKIIPSLDFIIPKPKSFFTRYGAAIVSDTLHEDLAVNFINYLVQKKDDLARYAGLLSLSGKGKNRQNEDVDWELYDETIPLTREVEVLFKNVAL